MPSKRNEPSTPTSLRTRSRCNHGGPRPGEGRPKKVAGTTAPSATLSAIYWERHAQQQLHHRMLASIQSYTNKRGSSLSRESSQLLLRIILFSLLQNKHTPSRLCRYLSKLAGVSYNTLIRLYAHWLHHDRLYMNINQLRGTRSPKHRYYDRGLPLVCTIAIHEFILECKNQGQSLTSRMIAAHLLENSRYK
jgi:hypothetical protein